MTADVGETEVAALVVKRGRKGQSPSLLRLLYGPLGGAPSIFAPAYSPCSPCSPTLRQSR